MKILICVKQVPEITDVTINPEIGTLMREGVDAILNPFCEYAVEMGLNLKRCHSDIVTVAISMGPLQAKSALMRCLEMGIDRAILLADMKFAGADTWATAFTLAQTIKIMENDFDLILVGKQAIDGDTAQVGPELAEILTIPQIMYAVGVDHIDNNKKVRVKRETEAGNEIVEVKLPALISLSKGPMIRSVSSFKDILDARKKELRVVRASELPIDENELGLKGSFTQVIKIFPPQVKKTGIRIDGSEPRGAAKKLIEFLQERKLI
jgi:electron transfer flavoprotein alpha/beta subunit